MALLLVNSEPIEPISRGKGLTDMEMLLRNFIYPYCQYYANPSVDSARYRRIRDEHCSTIVKNVLQIGLNYAKQSQFSKKSNGYKVNYDK